MSPEQRDRLMQLEFNLEVLEEDVDSIDPARADIQAALRMINLAMKR